MTTFETQCLKNTARGKLARAVKPYINDNNRLFVMSFFAKTGYSAGDILSFVSEFPKISLSSPSIH